MLTAGENHVQMAEDLSSPVDIADLVHPSASSTLAEKAWHFLLPGYTSGWHVLRHGHRHGGEADLAVNNALPYANQVIEPTRRTTPPLPSCLSAIRGILEVGFGPHYGYQQHVNPSDFAVWTFAYDVSGIATAQVKYRVDLDGVNPLTETDNDTYAGDPEGFRRASTWRWRTCYRQRDRQRDVDFFILPDVIATSTTPPSPASKTNSSTTTSRSRTSTETPTSPTSNTSTSGTARMCH